MSWSPVLISARTQKLEDTIRGHLKSITMHMSTFLRLPLMIVEIQLHRSFLPNVITMVLKFGASLWRGYAHSLVCSTFRPYFTCHYV